MKMNRKKILIIDDDKDILTLLKIKLKNKNFDIKTETSPLNALEILTHEKIDLVLVDQNMSELTGLEFIEIVKERFSELPVILITAYGNIEDAVRAIKLGALHYITKPINYDELQHIIKNALELFSLKEEIEDLKKVLSEEIIAESYQMKTILDTAKKISPFDTTVLITGESGTGKEILAKYIHRNSKRKNKPFIAVNCGAIPEDLLEAELFGYKRGAFTGAYTDKAGIIEEANGGTLFLDEIGELPLNLQVKLLRVLQEGEIKPLGSSKTKKINVRFIAATNRNLEKMVQEGKFREDLYYRLNVIRIEIPPIRERKGDILPLAKFFIKKYCAKYNLPPKILSEEAISELLSYSWPGNVRELENLIERAVLINQDDVIKSFFENNVSKGYTKAKIKKFKEAKEEFEKKYLKNLLSISKGNISKASKISGLTRAQIYRMLDRHGLRKREDS